MISYSVTVANRQQANKGVHLCVVNYSLSRCSTTLDLMMSMPLFPVKSLANTHAIVFSKYSVVQNWAQIGRKLGASLSCLHMLSLQCEF
jgi:hypothetical protein